MDAIDYIGTGGFIIECKNKEKLGVAKKEARIIFQNLGWNDDQKHLLQKSGWTLKVARHVIEILTHGETVISTFEVYQEVQKAADTIAIDVRLCNFINYNEPTLDQEYRSLDFLSDPRKWRCYVSMVALSDQWMQLVKEGIVLVPIVNYFVVKWHKEGSTVGTGQKPKQPQSVQYRLYSNKHALNALSHLHSMLHLNNNRNVSQGSGVCESLSQGKSQVSSEDSECLKEQWSISYWDVAALPGEHHEMVRRLTRKLQFPTKKSKKYTLYGPIAALHATTKGLPSDCHFQATMLLLVENPTPDMLVRFFHACNTCNEEIHMDVDLDAFYCQCKFMVLQRILAELVDNSIHVSTLGKFSVHLGSSKLF